MTPTPQDSFPRIDPLGQDALLVRFANVLSEPANRAALAFRNNIDQHPIDGIIETANSLAGVLIRFDPIMLPHAELTAFLETALAARDWLSAPLPAGRHLLRIPTAYGGTLGPQLAKAAELAGMSEAEAIDALSAARVRVMAIGFAPGQPYLGQLPDRWNLPRQTNLTTRVPPGALTLAVRQFVLFKGESQTGWHHIGQTHFRCFRPKTAQPFALRHGDEIEFPAVSAELLERYSGDDTGGASREVLE